MRTVVRVDAPPRPPVAVTALPEAKAAGVPVVDALQGVAPSLPTRLRKSFDTDYEAKMSQLSGGPAYSPGVRFLREGQEALQARLDAINSAESSILMTTYALEADHVTEQVLNALIAKAKQGVRVLVKSDAFPCTYVQGENADKENQKMFRMLRDLERAGGTVMFYGNEKDHRRVLGAGDHLKALVVDGKKVIAGGRNMSSDYFEGWRDFDGEFGGTVATQLAKKAVQMAEKADPLSLSRWTGERARMARARMADVIATIKADIIRAEKAAKPIGTKAWVMAWDPTYDRRAHRKGESANVISQALIESFNRAQKQIIVSSNFVNATPKVHAALVAAAKRGVQVSIVTSGEVVSTRSMFPYRAAESRYDDIRRYGGRVFETFKIEHAKMYYIDGEVAAFGSYNLEHEADDRLTEQLVFSRDAAFIERVHATLMSDINEICTEYKGPKDRGYFGNIWYWFLTLISVLTEDYF